MEKNLTLINDFLEQEHLGKDLFLIPYYLGKQNHCKVIIVYLQTPTNQNFPSFFRGVRFLPFRKRKFPLFHQLSLFGYLIKNASHINFLVCFHYRPRTVLSVIFYKILNPHGFAWVKGDLGAHSVEPLSKKMKSKSIKGFFKDKVYRLFLKKVDVFSCETSEVYHKIQQSRSPYFNFGSKLVFLPNGFDEEYLQHLEIQEKVFAEKENIMISVGSLDLPGKNIEMFLKALESVELKDWTIYLIGPVGDRLSKYIKAFYEQRPDYMDKVIFTGPLYDKKSLWTYYNCSKVFVQTSRSESYGLVLCEAKRFRNYIVSTNVGAFGDISENGKYGCCVEQDNAGQLKTICQNIIDGVMDIDVYRDFDGGTLSWVTLLEKCSGKLMESN